MICDEHKDQIATFVRSFNFNSFNSLIGVGGGGCLWYSVIGCTVLQELGYNPEIKFGSLFYRYGPNHRYDTILFADPNTGMGRIGDDGYLWGHAWIKLSGDVVDFSTGDWQTYMEAHHNQHPLTNWQVELPEYLWRPRSSLSKWRSKGVPKLGGFWYGPWSGPVPDVLGIELVLGEILRPATREFVRQLQAKVILQEAA